MKNVLIASGIAIFAIASIAGAQSYTFNTNLTVGSTGADVVALQTWLMANGYSIPSVASGAAAKGYFGAQTQKAVKAYQTAKDIPSTGFVGPLTRGALNGAPVASASMTCPAGYSCTPVAGTPTTVAPSAITTVGVPGTLVYAKQSAFSNTSLDKGKTVDVAKYKLQASASDMQVTSISFDFDKRLWLYAGTVTLKDDSGAVITSKSGLTRPDFSELTVGSSYRLTIPLNYVVPKTMWKYVTLSLTALPSSDRTSAETITITSSQARAVDGTGVNDTVDATGGTQAISWSGSSNAAIVTTINSASPATKLVQISTSVETDNVVLGVFDLKSQNTDTTLRTLKVFVNTNSGPVTTSLFNDIKLKIGGNVYSADSIVAGTSSSTVTFTNLDVNLPKDAYVSATILGKVAKNVSGSASTTLVANSTNIAVEDSSYATVSVNSATITANTQTFTTSGVVASNLQVIKEDTIAPQAGGISRIAYVKYTLTAGDNAVYVSKTQTTAVSSTTSLGTAGTATTTPYGTFTVDNTSGDGTTYFYIAPGQSKTFTAGWKTTGSSPTTSTGSLTVSALNYSTADTTGTGGSLSSSDITTALQINFF